MSTEQEGGDALFTRIPIPPRKPPPSEVQTARTRGSKASERSTRGHKFQHSSLNLMFEQPVGLDGKEINLGTSNEVEAEGRIHQRLGELQQRDYQELNRLLVQLRKEYDGLRQAVKSKTMKLQSISAELEQNDKANLRRGQGGDANTVAKVKRTEALETKIAIQEARHEESLKSREVLEHMMTRLKQQIVDVDKDINELQSESKAVKADTKDAQDALRIAKQDRVKAEKLAKKLKVYLEAGREKRVKKMQSVAMTLAEQEQVRRQYLERERQRQDIYRMARTDLSADEETRLKQLFLVRRMYASMLARRLEEDQRRVDALEQAFQRIRSATGLEAVEDIVDKFLSRGETFRSLQAQMRSSRDRIDALRRANQELSDRLAGLRAVGANTGENRVLYQKMDEYDRRLQEARRECTESKEKFIRLSITLEESRACIDKLLKKLDGASKPAQASDRKSAADDNYEFKEGSVEDVNGLIVGPLSSVDSLGVPAPESPDVKREPSVTSLDDRSNMEQDLMKVESKLSSMLATLATVFEREEQAVTRKSTSTSRTQSPHHEHGNDLGGAGRNTMLMLADKASEKVFRSMMSLPPDVSDRNLRVERRATTPLGDDLYAMSEHGASAASVGSENSSYSFPPGEGETSQQRKRMKNPDELAALLTGLGTDGVLTRDIVKRMSAMAVQPGRKRKQKKGWKQLGSYESQEDL